MENDPCKRWSRYFWVLTLAGTFLLTGTIGFAQDAQSVPRVAIISSADLGKEAE